MFCSLPLFPDEVYLLSLDTMCKYGNKLIHTAKMNLGRNLGRAGSHRFLLWEAKSARNPRAVWFDKCLCNSKTVQCVGLCGCTLCLVTYFAEDEDGWPRVFTITY